LQRRHVLHRREREHGSGGVEQVGKCFRWSHAIKATVTTRLGLHQIRSKFLKWR
jgi:hypothetical protein